MDIVIQYLAHPFVRYAFIVGILIAFCSSLLGVTLVLKRMSYIGDGLSHVAFGALAIASVLKLSDNMIIILPVTVLCAVLLLAAGRTRLSKAMLLSQCCLSERLLSVICFMNIFSTSSNLAGDVCSTLFGSTSILTLRQNEVYLCLVVSVVVVIVLFCSTTRFSL